MVEETLSLAEWTSVLKLAAMWRMDRLSNIVVGRMEALDVDHVDRDQWMKLLDLSDIHELSDARALAIERLSSLRFASSAAKVQLARKYGVEHWLREGLQELVQQTAIFSDEDEELLGWKTVIKLYRVRDGYLRSQYGRDPYGYYRHCDIANTNTTTIEAEFEAELERMKPEWVKESAVA
jgi:hypothetical protein